MLSKPVQCSIPNQTDVIKIYLKHFSSQTLPKPYFESFVQSSVCLPIQFQSISDHTYLNLNYLELSKVCKKNVRVIDLTDIQQNHLEELACGQATSKLWMKFQDGRINACHLC